MENSNEAEEVTEDNAINAMQFNTPSSEFCNEQADDEPHGCASNDSQYREYLQSFDRRHSETNYTKSHTSSCERINLADEIEKLSDRLMVLSTISAELTDENIISSTNENANITHQCDENLRLNRLPRSIESVERIESNRGESIKVSDSPQDVYTRRKNYYPGVILKRTEEKYVSSESLNDNDINISRHLTNGFSPQSNGSTRNSKYVNTFSNWHSMDDDTTIQSHRSFLRSKSVLSTNHYSSTKSRAFSVVNDLTERLKELDETPFLSRRMVSSRRSSTSTENICTNRLNGYARESHVSFRTQTSVPWPITSNRTKYRVNKMSRDVPIGSPDSHQEVYLKNAAKTTKDCLLHLLEKYNGRTSRNLSNIGRHQSISVGFGISDNLEYRSMNSLNAFFQRHVHGGSNVKEIQARIQSHK